MIISDSPFFERGAPILWSPVEKGPIVALFRRFCDLLEQNARAQRGAFFSAVSLQTIEQCDKGSWAFENGWELVKETARNFFGSQRDSAFDPEKYVRDCQIGEKSLRANMASNRVVRFPMTSERNYSLFKRLHPQYNEKIRQMGFAEYVFSFQTLDLVHDSFDWVWKEGVWGELSCLNYEPVAQEALRFGDIVFFRFESTSTPQSIGVWMEPGVVAAKFPGENGSLRYRLDEIPPVWGDEMTFFRPPLNQIALEFENTYPGDMKDSPFFVGADR